MNIPRAVYNVYFYRSRVWKFGILLSFDFYVSYTTRFRICFGPFDLDIALDIITRKSSEKNT